MNHLLIYTVEEGYDEDVLGYYVGYDLPSPFFLQRSLDLEGRFLVHCKRGSHSYHLPHLNNPHSYTTLSTDFGRR